jgi:hypothetical protein
MSWFNILKNEMRSINLPKFKVKPFNVNKPDEDDDCKRKVIEIENRLYARELISDSEMDALQNKLKNIAVDYDVKVMKRPAREHIQRYSITFSPRGSNRSRNIPENEYLKVMIRVDRQQYGSKPRIGVETFAESSLSEEIYCKVLDTIERDVEITEPNFMGEPISIKYWKKEEGEGDQINLDEEGDIIDRGRELSCIVGDKEYMMCFDLDCYLVSKAPKYLKQISKNEEAALRQSLVLIKRYLDNIKVKFTE